MNAKLIRPLGRLLGNLFPDLAAEVADGLGMDVPPGQPMATTLRYLKASNTDIADYFGFSVALSDDGTTLAVGAIGEEKVRMDSTQEPSVGTAVMRISVP